MYVQNWFTYCTSALNKLYFYKLYNYIDSHMYRLSWNMLEFTALFLWGNSQDFFLYNKQCYMDAWKYEIFKQDTFFKQDTSLIHFAHSWYILVNTWNKFHISYHPCINILYFFLPITSALWCNDRAEKLYPFVMKNKLHVYWLICSYMYWKVTLLWWWVLTWYLCNLYRSSTLAIYNFYCIIQSTLS